MNAGYLSPMTPSIEAGLRGLNAAQRGWISPTPDFTAGGGGSPWPTATAAGGGGGGAAPASQWSADNPYAAILAKYQAGIPTPGSLLGTARKSVAAELAPVLAALNQNSLVQQRQMSNQATRAGNFAEALARLNRAQGGDLAEGYQNAAQFLGTLGTGLTGAVAQDWQNQTQAAQAAVDQMTGGIPGQTVQGYDPAAMRTTQQMTGVTLPAADLAQQGLNAERGLVSQGMADVLGIGGIAQQYRAKVGDLQAQLAADRAKEIAQKPALVEKALEGLRTDRETALANVAKLTGGAADWEANKVKLAQNQQTLDIQQQGMDIKGKSADAYNAYLDSKVGLSGKELAWKKAYQNSQLSEKQWKDAAQLQVDLAKVQTQSDRNAIYRRAQAAGLWWNPNTKSFAKLPAGTVIGKNGFPVAVKGKTASTAKTKTPKLYELQNLRKTMTSSIAKALNIGNPLTPTKLQGVDPKTGKAWTRGQIVKFLRPLAGDLLTAYPNQGKTVERILGEIADQVVSQTPRPPEQRKYGPGFNIWKAVGA